jgi:hypothetical protein
MQPNRWRFCLTYSFLRELLGGQFMLDNSAAVTAYLELIDDAILSISMVGVGGARERFIGRACLHTNRSRRFQAEAGNSEASR